MTNLKDWTYPENPRPRTFAFFFLFKKKKKKDTKGNIDLEKSSEWKLPLVKYNWWLTNIKHLCILKLMKINNSNRELGTAAITTHVTETIGTVNVAVKLPGTNQDTLVTALNRRQTARTLCTAGLGEIASATSESLHTGDDDGVGVRLLSTGTKFCRQSWNKLHTSQFKNRPLAPRTQQLSFSSL